MRFMIIVKATKDSEAGVMPSEELLTEMGKFNEELVNAGVMLAGEGLQASSKGARVKFSGNTADRDRRPVRRDEGADRRLLDLAMKSKEEAIEWVKRCPNPMPNEESEIEIRQVFEAEISGPSSRLNSESKRSACARRLKNYGSSESDSCTATCM